MPHSSLPAGSLPAGSLPTLLTASHPTSHSSAPASASASRCPLVVLRVRHGICVKGRHFFVDFLCRSCLRTHRKRFHQYIISAADSSASTPQLIDDVGLVPATATRSSHSSASTPQLIDDVGLVPATATRSSHSSASTPSTCCIKSLYHIVLGVSFSYCLTGTVLGAGTYVWVICEIRH